MLARQDHFDSTAGFPNFQDDRPDSLVRPVAFARNLFAARQHGFNLADADNRRSTFETNNRSADQFVLHVVKLVEDRIPFCFSKLLDHHLLGRLSRHSAKNVSQFFRIEFLFIAFNSWLTVFAIDVNFQFEVFAEMLTSGREDRLFDPVEDNLLVDVFVAVQRVNDSENFVTVHFRPFETMSDRRTINSRRISPVLNSKNDRS